MQVPLQYGSQLYDDLRAMIRACESLHTDRRHIELLHAILVQTSGSAARVSSGIYFNRNSDKSNYSTLLRSQPKMSTGAVHYIRKCIVFGIWSLNTVLKALQHF